MLKKGSNPLLTYLLPKKSNEDLTRKRYLVLIRKYPFPDERDQYVAFSFQ